MALPATDGYERLAGQLAGAERDIRNALLGALLATRSELDLRELAELIEAGRFDEAVELAVRNGTLRLTERTAAVYLAAGASTAAALQDAMEVAVSFDHTNWRAVEFLRSERLRLITGFTAEQRAAAREALAAGTARGENPVRQAMAFRDSVGLTARQQTAVDNYRSMLERLDGEALRRDLRDRRFDRTVRGAISRGEPLTQEQVDRMVQRYSERYVRYRSNVIARTEALRAVNSADYEMYQQAVDDGLLDPEQLVRTWVAVMDSRTRHSHARLSGEERGFGERWRGDYGWLRFPGDPDAPGAETIQCRCVLTTHIAEG